MKYLGYSLFLMLFLSACAIEPAPINYGQDACEFCKMNIVDQQHAAEIVTKKGKSYKYDAVECMLNYLNRNDLASEEMAFLLVCNYNQPGELIDARDATYIISEAIPSPMGAFLSALDNPDSGKQIIEVKGGEVVTWEELKKRYEVK
jgi:copper chaperone NosL